MDESWNIVYYQAPQQSSSPVYDFIYSLGQKARTKVANTITIL